MPFSSVVISSNAGMITGSKATSAPASALTSTVFSRSARTFVLSPVSRMRNFSVTGPAKLVRLWIRPTARSSSPSRTNEGVLSSTKKSLRVSVWAVAWPTSVSTVQPRAVKRQAVVVSGIGTVTTALPFASVMIDGSQRPSPRTSCRRTDSSWDSRRKSPSITGKSPRMGISSKSCNLSALRLTREEDPKLPFWERAA